MEKFVPKVDEKYFYVDFGDDDLIDSHYWSNDYIDENILNTCGCYRTEEEARKVAKEMLGIYEISVSTR